MSVVSHGVDMVEVARVAAMLERHGDRAKRRIFTEDERAYCESNSKRCVEHYAARFAAKEAVFKALGTGWSGGIEWTDAEVVRDHSGKPSIALSSLAAEAARDLGIVQWSLSLTHTGSHAMASVIAMAE